MSTFSPEDAVFPWLTLFDAKTDKLWHRNLPYVHCSQVIVQVELQSQSMSWKWPHAQIARMFGDLHAMNGENRPLVTDEPIGFEK